MRSPPQPTKQTNTPSVAIRYTYENLDVPMDYFQVLFCPRCDTYGCQVHRIEHYFHKKREAGFFKSLEDDMKKMQKDPKSQASNGFKHINCYVSHPFRRPALFLKLKTLQLPPPCAAQIEDHNALALEESNGSRNNTQIEFFLPNWYEEHHSYPSDLRNIAPCSDNCYFHVVVA